MREDPLPLELSNRSGLDIFSSLIRTSRKHPELSKHKQEAIEHQFQLIRLWGDGFDAPRGGLDRHLLYSRDLQQTTLPLLISTSEILSQRLVRYMLPSADARRSLWETTDIATLLEEARCSNSENTEFDDEANRSDESEANFPTDSIDEVLEDLKVGIRCLIDLIPSILWPAEARLPARAHSSSVLFRPPQQKISRSRPYLN